MYLTADIGHILTPVSKTSIRASITTRFLSFLESLQQKAVNNVILELDSAILALEGVLIRVEKLNSEQAESIIDDVSKSILKLDKISDSIASYNYFESKDVKERIIYAQKCLYKIEAKLHRRVYKQKNISSTSSEIKDGISKLNVIYSS